MTFSFNAAPVRRRACRPDDVARARTLRISEESPFDVAAREALLDEAFGLARAEKTSARLRDGRLPARGLALVARDGGELVGTLALLACRGGRPRRAAARPAGGRRRRTARSASAPD